MLKFIRLVKPECFTPTLLPVKQLFSQHTLFPRHDKAVNLNLSSKVPKKLKFV